MNQRDKDHTHPSCRLRLHQSDPRQVLPHTTISREDLGSWIRSYPQQSILQYCLFLARELDTPRVVALSLLRHPKMIRGKGWGIGLQHQRHKDLDFPISTGELQLFILSPALKRHQSFIQVEFGEGGEGGGGGERGGERERGI